MCRVPYKFYPALTLFVVSFLVGYSHEVVGTSGKKKNLNKGKVIYCELKGRKKMALHSIEASCFVVKNWG